MIFEEKSKEINYRKYSNRIKSIERRITLNSGLAEELNIMIAVFSNAERTIKMNTSILCSIALNNYLKELYELNEDDAIEKIKKEVLNLGETYEQYK